MEQKPSIAFLGMGLMGTRMASRLLEAGFDVAVWNRTANACQSLLDQGARALSIESISHFPLIMTCLADDDAVLAVYELISPYLSAGQRIIDFSSLTIATTKALAKISAEQHVLWIDAPVSGGTIGAEQGSLVVFAGGVASVISALDFVFAPLAQKVTHMGPVGSGQATKICNQLIVAANSGIIAEAIALAAQMEIDANKFCQALEGGFADSKPLQILAPRMFEQQFNPVQWKVHTLAKDLKHAVNLLKDYGVEHQISQSALDVYHKHQAAGYGEYDLSSLVLATTTSAKAE